MKLKKFYKLKAILQTLTFNFKTCHLKYAILPLEEENSLTTKGGIYMKFGQVEKKI